MRKFIALLITGVFCLGMAIPVFAEGQGGDTPKKHQVYKCKENKHSGLETVIKDSLKKNNRDLAKVKTDVEKFMADKTIKQQEHLNKIAAKKGIKQEEMKAQFEKKRAEKLKEIAAKKGVSVDVLKEKMQAKRQSKLEGMAKNLGITTEELKQILPNQPQK